MKLAMGYQKGLVGLCISYGKFRGGAKGRAREGWGGDKHQKMEAGSVGE